MTTLSPVPPSIVSAPGPPMQHVVAVAAEQRVVAVAADEHVVAGSAAQREQDGAGGHAEASITSSLARALTVSRSVAALGAGHRHRGGEAADGRVRAGAGDGDDVVAVRGVGDHVVGRERRRRRRRAARSALTLVTSVPGQVVDHDAVGAAERLGVDRLDVVEVHHDGRDVAGEAHAAAVGGDVHVLVGGAAVEQHAVGAVLALDHVAAVARIPLERVVAGSEERGVVALLAVDEVVAVAAEQDVDRRWSRAACRCPLPPSTVMLDQRGQVAGRGEACRRRRWR